MKIKLKADLPLDKRHGAFKDEVFETIAKTDPDPRAVWFLGRSGEEVKVFLSEFDLVDEAELASRYGVSKATISRIIARRR